MLDARRLNRRLDGPCILVTWHAEQIVVRHAPQFDNLPNSIGELYRKFSRRAREPSRHLAPREVRYVVTLKPHNSACRAQCPRTQTQERGFPRAIWPKQANHLASGKMETHV